MPEYLAPGVYVEEIDSGPKPIEGVSTSTAGMVGATEMGPIDGLPRLVTSFSDFQRLYGGFLPEIPWGNTRFLAYAVQGFFQNGGQRLFLQRVVGQNAAASSRDLLDGVSLLGSDFLLTRLAEDMDEDRNEAALISSRGVQAGTNLTFVQRVGAGEQQEVAVVDTVDGNRVTLVAPTGFRFTRSAVILIDPPAAFGGAATTLRLSAANPGAWGDRLRVQSTPSSRTSTRLLGIDLSTRLARQNVPLTLATIVQGDTNATLGAGEVANLREGDELRFDNSVGTENRQIRLGPGPDQVEFDDPLTLDYTIGANTVELLTPVALRVNAPTANVTVAIDVTPGFQQNDQIIIGEDGGAVTGTISAAPPVTNDSLSITLDQPFPSNRDLMSGTRLRLLNAGRGGDTVRIAGARNLYVGGAVELENASDQRIYATVLAVNSDEVQLSENVPASYLEGDAVRTCEFDLRVQFTRTNQVTGREEVVRDENHRLLSFAAGATNNVISRVNEDSALVRAEDLGSGNPSPFNFPTTIDRNNFTSFMFLENGDDGDPPLPRHYRGTDNGPGARTGIPALEDIDVVSIIAAPGIFDVSVQGVLIEQCERLKDRFAVLDGPTDADIQEIQEHRGNYDTRYAAIYHPWITLRDPLDDIERNVPPSGHMIGVYARTDIERGVHKAPANEVIRGIIRLEQVLNKREQDILNPSPVNINVLRDFRERGLGLRVWGARVITSDTEWKYVNVRRLFIFLEESIDQGTQWAVFEPNDDRLWAQIIQAVSAFLTNVWRDGALFGRTAEEAFFVKCDRTTMTQDDIDNGRLIMIIGVAPVKPAEFVIIRIGQFAGGSEVSEQ
jgi:uncharacterized protein